MNNHTVIVIPRLTDFVREVRQACSPDGHHPPEVRTLHTRRMGGRTLPTCFLGTRLTARAPDGSVRVWTWERDFLVDAEGRPFTDAQRAREAAFRRAQDLIEAALKQAGVRLRPGAIALDRNLELVQCEPDALRFHKDGNGHLAVELDPDWLARVGNVVDE